MNLGSISITALYLGSTAISTVYLGSTQIYSAGGAFSPLSLFSSGEEGAWYEPSPTSTFTDIGGYTFATYGQTVSHLIDKSQGATIEARRNLLERTEEFDNAYWGKANLLSFGSGSTANATTAPDGSTTADLLVENSSTGIRYVNKSVTPTLTTTTFSVSVKQGPGSPRFFLLSQSFQQSTNVGTRWVCVDLSDGSISDSGTGQANSGAIPTLVSQIVTPQGDGWYRVSLTVTNTTLTTTHYNFLGFSDTGTPTPDFYGRLSYTGDGTSGIYIWGAQLEEASSASAYQKITDGQTVSWLPGNHATQITADNRPTLARVPVGGRRNLLERTEEFDNAYWTKTNNFITSQVINAATDPNGSLTAEEYTNDASSSNSLRITRTMTAEPYTFSVWLKAKAAGDIGKYVTIGGHASGSVHNRILAQLPAEWTRFSASGSATVAAWDYGVDGRTDGVFAGLNQTQEEASFYVWGAQLEEGSSATAYQKVVSEYDVTEAGVDSLDYLSFDGTNDGMATASIDFTSTDKMSVFAGVRKLSDAAVGQLVELSSGVSAVGNTGSFSMPASDGGSTWIGAVRGSGTPTVATATSLPAPITTVNTLLGDLSLSTGDAKLRVNGTLRGTSSTDTGGGNFGDYQLNIGARDVTVTPELFFNGHIYGLIVRGATSTTDEITDTEAYLATRSGVTIP